jgi:hypothetical protein
VRRAPPAPTPHLGKDGRTYQEYVDERKHLVGLQRGAGDSFDKVLLTLSAGAVAVSVTFAEKLGAAGLWKPLLYTAWGVLTLSLVLNLRGFLLLIASLSRSIDRNDELWVTGECDTDDPFAPKIMSLNNASFWLLCVGALMLLVFSGVNYQASEGNKTEPQKVIVIMANEQGAIRRIVEGTLKKTSPAPPVVKVPNDRPQSTTTTSGNDNGSKRDR